MLLKPSDGLRLPIDFGKNNFQSAGTIRALTTTKTLIKMNASRNNICDNAADEIALALSLNPKLQKVDLSENNLHTKGAMKIARSLRSARFDITQLG